MNDKEHYAELMLKNKALVKETINAKLSGLPESEKVDVLFEELSNILSLQNTRLDVMEKVIAREFDINNKDKELMALAVLPQEKIIELKLDHELHWFAAEIADNMNLYPIEQIGHKAIRWTGPDVSTKFNIPQLSGNKFVLQIGIEAVIESEYLRQIKTIVNGKVIKNKLKYIEGKNYIIASYTTQHKDKYTEIELIVPETKSPLQLGASDDNRLLGFAISDLHVIQKPSSVSRLRNKIKST